MNGSKRITGRVAAILFVALAILAISNTLLGSSRGDDVQSSVFQAYVGLAEVYASGGQAPELVARLNGAIQLAQQANIKRENGDVIGAASLDNEAEAEITSIISGIPFAQQNADQVSSTRTLTALVLVPVSVTVSTLVFFVALRAWRGYKRRQLYGMRIIEKAKED